MKKILILLSLMMACCVAVNAAATSYQFTFRDTGGNPYCDGMYLALYKGAGSKTLVDGYHFNTFCQGTYTGVNGFKAGVHAAYQYNAAGATMIVSDPVGGGTGMGVVWLVNPTYRTWVVYFSGFGAGEYVGNYGTWINGARAEGKGNKPAIQP